MHAIPRPGRRWLILAAAVLATLSLAWGLFQASPGHAASSAGQAGIAARTGHVGPGTLVHVQSSSKPFAPTAAQKAARNRAMRILDNLPAGPVGAHPARAAIPRLTGPQTSPANQPQAATNNFQIFKNSTIPTSCATDCAQSTVNEPDTAASGKDIFQTSNWDIAYTTNGGAATPTWLYQDPYTFQGSFCCDQTITYVPNRNRVMYEGLTLGSGTATGFTIASTRPQSPTAWCKYHFNGASFGGTAGDILDYPKIAYGNNNLYVTWNEYNSSGSTWLRTGLARFPLDALTNCSGFSYNYLTRTDNFTFGLSSSNTSLDQFYWVSNWYTTSGGSGTSERVFWWPENGTTYFFKDIAVNAYNFAGGSCASADGVVTNWCSRLDPRWETASITRAEWPAQGNSAFAGDATLAVAITAGPGGGDPFPYVLYEYFKLNALTYITTAATFNNGFAFAYGACSPNAKGALGCVASYGGGTGTTHFFPGGIVILQDNVTPTQPWTYSFNVTGAGNGSAWGDYMYTQPFEPDVGPFITTEWAVNGSNVVVPHVVIFGRAHDYGYSRWQNS